MMTPKERQRSLVITFALAVAAIGYVVFVFLPKQKVIARQRVELSEQQTYIFDAESRTLAMQHTQLEQQRAEEYVRLWRQVAPETGKLAPLFADIARLGDSSKVAVTRFDPQSTVQLDTIWYVPVLIGLDGNFSQLFVFLRGLENLPATVWIDNVRIEPNTARRNKSRQDSPPIWGLFPDHKESQSLHCELTLTVFADRDDFSE